MADKDKKTVDEATNTNTKLSPEFQQFIDKTLKYDTMRPHHQLGPLADRIGLHVPPFDRKATLDRYFKKEEEEPPKKEQ